MLPRHVAVLITAVGLLDAGSMGAGGAPSAPHAQQATVTAAPGGGAQQPGGTLQPGGTPQPGQAPRPGRPARDTARESPPTGTARIRGLVVAAENGVPLRRAVVRFDARELREGRTATTDADGRFEVRDLPGGRYNVSASKGGYVTLQYGQRRAFEQGRPLEIRDGQLLDGVVFALPRGGVITGRVVDEFGEPVADAMVSSMRFQYFRGRRRLVPSGRGDTTNDLGQYRLFGLAPGEYFVSATLRGGFFAGEGAATETTGYAPTYFPGTTSTSDAQAVRVAIGQEAAADFALVPSRLVRVTGSVVDSSGRPVAEGMVRVTPRSDAGGGVFFMGSGARLRDDGTFTVGGVAPGSYTLAVNTGRGFGFGGPNEEVESEYGSVPITVGNEDVTGVLIATTKGATATGQVVVEEGSSGISLSALRVFASPADLDETMAVGPPATSRVNEDGTFELRNLFGRRMLNIGPTGPGAGSSPWRIEAMYLGHEDITDTGFEARGGQRITGLQIVLTTQTTEISGTVADGRGAPVKDYAVIVFAADERKWMHPSSRYTRSARPDQEGKYSLSGLPPGDYLAIAVEYADPTSIGDPELLTRLRDAATGVSLRDGEKKALNLVLSAQ
jgi:protocatechuate 3,4-dioxygenase beta subunit